MSGVKKLTNFNAENQFIPALNNPMPGLASFFDAMSGVKKLTNFNAATNCPTSAFEPSCIMKPRLSK